MTSKEIQLIIKQKEKVDSIKLIAEQMLLSGNWFSKAASWAIMEVDSSLSTKHQGDL